MIKAAGPQKYRINTCEFSRAIVKTLMCRLSVSDKARQIHYGFAPSPPSCLSFQEMPFPFKELEVDVLYIWALRIA